MKIAVVGAGYVGLVTAAVLAERGNQVFCVEHNLEKAKLIQSGVSPIFEPGLDEVLSRTISSGNLVITNSIENSLEDVEIVFIAVGTPALEDGSTDMSAVRAVAHQLGKVVTSKILVVIKSTVPIGSAEMVRKTMIEAGADPTLFRVVSNPEFLREGTALSDTRSPDRIVIGCDDSNDIEILKELYSDCTCPILVTGINSAEIIKYAANCFLAVKISYANALSRLCEMCDADMGEVSRGIGSDSRIGPAFLNAGLGWGGSCLPKDVLGLYDSSVKMGSPFHLLKEIERINDDQPVVFLKRLESRLGTLKNKRVCLLGLAFKPNTDDIRYARSLILIENLLAAGAEISAHDPKAMPAVSQLFSQVSYFESAEEAVQNSDAVLLVTEWAVYKDMDWKSLASSTKTAILYDGRRALDRAKLQSGGWEYHTIGSRC